MKKIWNFFCSLKLAEISLYLIMIVSIIASFYLSDSRSYVSLGTTPLLKWVIDMGGDKLRLSWWMISLIILAALLFTNTLVCSIDRLEKITKFISKPNLLFKEQIFDFLIKEEVFIKTGRQAEAIEEVRKALTSSRYKVFCHSDEQSTRFCARKGILGILGPYIAHLGFLLFLIAHLLSGSMGVKHNNISVFSDIKSGVEGLPFLVQMQGKIPFDSYSRNQVSLSVWKNKNSMIKSGTAKINAPYSLDGYYFYFEGYDRVLRSIALEVVLEDGFSKYIPIGFEEEKTVRGDTSILVGPLISNFNSSFSHDSEENGSPAFLVSLKEGDKILASRWFFPYIADYTRSVLGETKVFLRDIVVRDCAKINIVSNPGVLWALAGGVLFLFGMTCSTLISYNRTWGILRPTENKEYILLLGGKSSINSYAFQREISKIIAKVR